jgi:type IV pilus assembly protein PilW
MSATAKMTAAHLRRQHGFTLVELMVALAISLFLLFGLVTVVQNVRKANANAQALSLLQDQQRFAFTVLTDVIQQGGYFPLPQTYSTASLVAWSGPLAWESAPAGQAFFGSHAGGTTPDTLGVSYMAESYTAANQDQVILCDGSTNTTGAVVQYANQFSIVPAGGSTPAYLQCQLNANTAVPLVYGVTNMTIYYGVNRNAPTVNYNVDTYLTADQMCSACTSNDWLNISSVRVVLQFTNPLFGQGTTQPATITMERVIPVMGRSGDHS